MLTLKGIYEHGVVRLLEPVPAETREPIEVLVTFEVAPKSQPDPADPEALKAVEGIIGLLNDLSPEQMAEFDDAIKRRGPFFGPREVAW